MFLLLLMAVAGGLMLAARLAGADRPPADPAAGLFARDNLVAWCIVPFDSKKRGPPERAKMLGRLGSRRFAYDWRAEHLPSFEAELAALKRAGITLQAVWFPASLDRDARHILGVLRKHGIKILLSWTPYDDERSNDEKRALVERIGAECAGLEMPFFLEPVGYDPAGKLAPNSAEYARLKPEIVIETMREFSRDIYHVDVLKVEFPINAAYVENTSVFSGTRVWSRDAALDIFRRADAAAGSYRAVV